MMFVQKFDVADLNALKSSPSMALSKAISTAVSLIESKICSPAAAITANTGICPVGSI